MATVTRTNRVSAVRGKPVAATRRAQIVQAAVHVELPTQKSEAVNDVNAYCGLIHGRPGIGKTSCLMAEPNAYLMTFDRPEKSLEVYQTYFRDWPTFEAYVEKLYQQAQAGTLTYTRVVVDGIDIAHRLCQAETEASLKVDDLSDVEWGKGFNQQDKRFFTTFNKLMALMDAGCGVWFIAHTSPRETKDRFGTAKEKLLPAMKAGCERVVVGRVNFVFFYEFDANKRTLIIRGSDRIYAKCNIQNHFLTSKGERVFEVPMGDSAEEGWSNLLRAFDNQQTFTHVKQPVVRPGLQPRTPATGGKDNNGKVSLFRKR